MSTQPQQAQGDGDPAAGPAAAAAAGAAPSGRAVRILPSVVRALAATLKDAAPLAAGEPPGCYDLEFSLDLSNVLPGRRRKVALAAMDELQGRDSGLGFHYDGTVRFEALQALHVDLCGPTAERTMEEAFAGGDLTVASQHLPVLRRVVARAGHVRLTFSGMWHASLLRAGLVCEFLRLLAPQLAADAAAAGPIVEFMPRVRSGNLTWCNCSEVVAHLREPHREDWLDELPDSVDICGVDFALTVDGTPPSQIPRREPGSAFPAPPKIEHVQPRQQPPPQQPPPQQPPPQQPPPQQPPPQQPPPQQQRQR